MVKEKVIRQVNDGGNTWIDCSLEAFNRAKENGIPVREVCLREESFRAAFDVWQDKTDWVQNDRRFEVLKPWGMHRADVLKAYIEHLESRKTAMDSEPVAWINGCNKSVPSALRYLAENPRPIGGESSFNTVHLYQLAREIELMAEAPLYRHAKQPVVPDESYQQLSELYHAQGKRLFKIAQRIKGLTFDKYSHTPSQAIDVLEGAIFGENDGCRAASIKMGTDSVGADMSDRNQPGMVVAVHIDAGDFVKFRGRVFEVKETDFDDHDVTLWFVCGEALKCAAGCQIEVVSAPVEDE